MYIYNVLFYQPTEKEKSNQTELIRMLRILHGIILVCKNIESSLLTTVGTWSDMAVGICQTIDWILDVSRFLISNKGFQRKWLGVLPTSGQAGMKGLSKWTRTQHLIG